MLKFKILPLVQVDPDNDTFDINKIRQICSHGLDECEPDDRAVAWIVLSYVFPNTPKEWNKIRAQNLETYKQFISYFDLVDFENRDIHNDNSITDFGLKNNRLMEIIHGDVIRASHHIQFFPYPDPNVEIEKEEDILNPYHIHMRRLERILYIFGSLNPTKSYMQGFHELCSVFYYVYSQALPYFNNDWLEVETTVFYSFQQLFTHTSLNELYTTQDKSSLIHKSLSHFMDLLKIHNLNAYNIIMIHRIDPLFFAFRWFNLLFSQEYDIPNLIRLWDSLFAYFDNLIDFAMYLGVARVDMLSDRISQDDYIQTMMTLQKVPVDNVMEMLRKANQFWEEDHPIEKTPFEKNPLEKILKLFQ